VTVFPLPDDTPEANLNTASFDADGTLWFTAEFMRLGWPRDHMSVLRAIGSGPMGV
jgi:streptogramin lyase